MSLFNVIDTRTNEFNNRCDAVLEIFSNDWTMYNTEPDEEDTTEWVNYTDVHDAIEYAMKIRGLVTVYFYDPNTVEENHGYLTAVHPKLKRKPITIK